MPAPCYIGIDFGTSGCRAIAIDEHGQVLASAERPLSPANRPAPGHAEQDPEIWWQALLALLAELTPQLAGYQPAALSLDGTSGTLLLCDSGGRPLSPALMYDDSRARLQCEELATIAPPEAAVHSPSASLPKLLWLLEQRTLPAGSRALHQAEWLLGRLAGRFDRGDENNCLKLGYDPQQRTWPRWLKDYIDPTLLPEVLPIGQPIGTLDPAIASEVGLPPTCQVISGTTDSTAAALAAGIEEIGDAVTSLGSTLVLKILSAEPVFDPAHGVYSHRVFDQWLVGGASNSGGAVLLLHFSRDEMAELTPQLQPEQPTGLDYYPLPRPGERFPHNDPQLAPRIEPIPQDRRQFFQGLLEGIAAVEQQGYALLQQLGAGRPKRLISVGGGARNPGWSAIRQRLVGVPLAPARHNEAAYGSALLAQRGHTNT